MEINKVTSSVRRHTALTGWLACLAATERMRQQLRERQFVRERRSSHLLRRRLELRQHHERRAARTRALRMAVPRRVPAFRRTPARAVGRPRREIPARAMARVPGPAAARGGPPPSRATAAARPRRSHSGRSRTRSSNAAPGSGNGVGTGLGGYVTLNDSKAGGSRGFAMRLPDNYDNTKPYWLIFDFHWNGGNSAQVDNGGTSGYEYAYYGLQSKSKNGAIFVGPDSIGAGWSNSSDQDLYFTDDMVKLISDNYCVDMSNIITTGFSWGGGMSYELACARADPSAAGYAFRAAGDLRRSEPQRVRHGRQEPHRPVAEGRPHGHHMSHEPCHAHSRSVRQEQRLHRVDVGPDAARRPPPTSRPSRPCRPRLVPI